MRWWKLYEILSGGWSTGTVKAPTNSKRKGKKGAEGKPGVLYEGNLDDWAERERTRKKRITGAWKKSANWGK